MSAAVIPTKRLPRLRAHLWRDDGGLYFPRWMTPTELLWQLEFERRNGPWLLLQIDSLAGSS